MANRARPKWKYVSLTKKQLSDGEPCSHTGCLSHISHPCEDCGRIGGITPAYDFSELDDLDLISMQKQIRDSGGDTSFFNAILTEMGKRHRKSAEKHTHDH